MRMPKKISGWIKMGGIFLSFVGGILKKFGGEMNNSKNYSFSPITCDHIAKYFIKKCREVRQRLKLIKSVMITIGNHHQLSLRRVEYVDCNFDTMFF